MEYFEEKLFSSGNLTDRYKKLNNDFFHKLITSIYQKLFLHLQKMRNFFDRMDGHYLIYHSMYEMTQGKILYEKVNDMYQKDE